MCHLGGCRSRFDFANFRRAFTSTVNIFRQKWWVDKYIPQMSLNIIVDEDGAVEKSVSLILSFGEWRPACRMSKMAAAESLFLLLYFYRWRPQSIVIENGGYCLSILHRISYSSQWRLCRLNVMKVSTALLRVMLYKFNNLPHYWLVLIRYYSVLYFKFS